MGKQSISRELARFVHGLSFAKLPSEVIDRTKNLVLDALTSAIDGRQLPEPDMALNLVKGNTGTALVWTHKQRLPAMDAAFVNAIQTTTTGQADTIYSLLHPGTIIVPAIIAVAEEEGSSGAEIITSLVVGYDIMGRLYLAAPSVVPRFRGSPVFGPFGAAAAVGKLFKLDKDQLTAALGYAGNFSSGFSQCYIAGTMERTFHIGMASRNGIMAAAIARNGATAAEDTLEGRAGFYQAFAGTTEGVDTATIDLGKKFLVMDVTYKPYPVCALLQITVDLAERLAKEHEIYGKRITKVVVAEPEETYCYPGINNPGPLTSRVHGIMSAQFCTAAALLAKPVTSYAFYENYDDAEVVELAGRVELKQAEEDRDTVRIEVTLQDGKRYSIEGGGQEILVPTTDRVKAKFDKVASDFLGKERADRIASIVFNLDKVDNVGELTRQLE